MAATVAGEVQAAILAQRRPAVAHVDVELPDGQIERVAVGAGRYRALEAGRSVEALHGVAVRLVGKDGAVLRALRFAAPEPPAAPPPAPTAPQETEAERSLRIIGQVYDRAYAAAAAAAAAQAEATRAEREVAWRGIVRAMEVMGASIDRAAEQLAELSEREREASAREVEAATAAADAAGPAGAVATVLRELPAAAPAIAQMAAMVRSSS